MIWCVVVVDVFRGLLRDLSDTLVTSANSLSLDTGSLRDWVDVAGILFCWLTCPSKAYLNTLRSSSG